MIFFSVRALVCDTAFVALPVYLMFIVRMGITACTDGY